MEPRKRGNRRSIRLKGYDYSKTGAYFVTICAQNRVCLFGNIVDGKMMLNQFGQIVDVVWNDLPNHYPHIQLDIYCIMPNHFHGIVMLTDTVGAIHELPLQMSQQQRRNMLLPKLIGRFKMLSSKQINQSRHTTGTKLWQRNYYEHIIRDEKDYNRICEYIKNNPLKWELDSLHPENEGFDE